MTTLNDLDDSSASAQCPRSHVPLQQTHRLFLPSFLHIARCRLGHAQRAGGCRAPAAGQPSIHCHYTVNYCRHTLHDAAAITISSRCASQRSAVAAVPSTPTRVVSPDALQRGAVDDDDGGRRRRPGSRVLACDEYRCGRRPAPPSGSTRPAGWTGRAPAAARRAKKGVAVQLRRPCRASVTRPAPARLTAGG